MNGLSETVVFFGGMIYFVVYLYQVLIPQEAE
jgi:hypothetical protein